jgi:hypothetical protein
VNSSTLLYWLLALSRIYQKEVAEILKILLVHFINIPFIGIGVTVTPSWSQPCDGNCMSIFMTLTLTSCHFNHRILRIRMEYPIEVIYAVRV